MGREGRGRGRTRQAGRERTATIAQGKPKEQGKQYDQATAKFVVGTARQASDYNKIKKYCFQDEIQTRFIYWYCIREWPRV